MDKPSTVKSYLRLRIGERNREAFVVLLLNAQHQLIDAVELFRGTLTQTSVYPREVVRAALDVNAAAVMFAHNHPSGVPAASAADKELTKTLRSALALIDVRVLDHFIVTPQCVTSFAEMGLL